MCLPGPPFGGLITTWGRGWGWQSRVCKKIKIIKSSKMAKLVEMVRNSPLMQRKGSGGYKVLDSGNKDPFVKGIPFNIYYYASAEVQHTQNTPEVQQTVAEVCEDSRKNSKPLRKVVLTVKASCITVTDVATKICDDYPIFRIAYCGGHGEYEDTFFFIHKTKLDKTLRVEVFKCSSEGKVKAITLTAAKAFNIAYKAWTLGKKKKEKKSSGAEAARSESPLEQHKAFSPPGKSNLAKMAPGIATGRTHTPPAPRKPPLDSDIPVRTRSGSFGDKPLPSSKLPMVRTMVHNENTGSSHNVVLTDDFDKEFQELAESRVQPEVLRTSLEVEETDGFNLDNILDHVDEGTEED